MPALQTARLDLVPATAAHLLAELESPAALAHALAIDVPRGWPPAPDLYDEDAIRHTLRWLHDHPDDAEWGFYYLARRAAGERRSLIGVGGFKGAPDDDGTVEIGYAVVDDERRQGYATEAVLGWTHFAFAHPRVTRVIGQTLPSLTASIRVLEKAGFRPAGFGHDPDAPAGETVLRYELVRATFRSG